MNSPKILITVLAALSFSGSATYAYDPNSPAGDPLEQGWKGVVGATSLSPSFTSGLVSGNSTDSRMMKIVEAAREDIAYFVATDGAARTARFNQAMGVLRQMSGDQQAQDMELAKGVLGY